MMKYAYLEQDYIDDVIAENLHAREVEHFHYALDLDNFRHIVAHSNEPELRADMEHRIGAIVKSIALVEKVMAALAAQITDTARHEKAVARCAAKRAAEKKAGRAPQKTTRKGEGHGSG